jgi:hypothetical protein
VDLPDPVIVHEWVPAPPPGPIAGWWDEADRLEIALPGLGAIRVDPDRILVSAPTQDEADRLTVRLGSWARAHWWTMQGLAACRGTVVGRDGQAIALVGIERTGASLLALALTTHGWSVVSDGIAVVDEQGWAMNVPGPVTVDAGPAAHLAYDFPRVHAASGRDRVGFLAPSHPSAPLVGYVSVRARRSIPALVVEGPVNLPAEAPGPGTAIASGRMPAAPLPVGAWWRVERPIPQDVEAMRRSAPSVIAALLAPLLDGAVIA